MLGEKRKDTWIYEDKKNTKPLKNRLKTAEACRLQDDVILRRDSTVDDKSTTPILVPRATRLNLTKKRKALGTRMEEAKKKMGKPGMQRTEGLDIPGSPPPGTVCL